MDPYHWSKQRSQPTRTSPTQPPSQSPRQQHQHQQPLPASSPPSFLSQPLMSAGFPTYPHQSHPPPSAQPPFQTLHHSQSVRDTIVPHPHSYQPVPTPLSVAIQHPLPQLPQLHHRLIPSHNLSTPQHTSKVAPSQSQLRIQHPSIQRAAHTPHPTHPAHGQTSQQQPQTQPQPQESQQQPQQQQQQTQQQEQSHQQPVAQQSGQQPTQQPAQHHSQNPSSQQSPSMRPPQSQPPPQSDPQSNRPHPSLHPSPHHHHHHQHQQQQRSTSMQPPPRQLSSPNIPSPRSRDASPAQHIAVNSQVMAQQLSHIPQPSQQQQHLVQHPIQQQQPPPQQQPHHQHQHQQYVSHPPRQQQQPVDPARVVYDNSSVYRLSQPQQQYYNPYSTPQQHVQPQAFPQHPPLYSSVPIPNHEYQQQQSSMPMAQDSSARPFPSSRIPAIHQQGQPTAQHPRPPQGPLSQQQQPAQHMQSSQRQHPKLVSSLQPQPIQMVQIGATPAQQPQDPQSQHLVQQQTADQIHRQTMPPGQLAQSHQLGHSQQSRHMAQTQALPLASQHPHLPDRRTASSHMHPTAQGQMHMASAPIPTTMQLQQHQHQMQHQVMPGQPMQPRERHHAMQPLASQQPKPSHHQIVQPPLQSQPPPQLQPQTQTQTQTAPQGQAQGQGQSQPPPQPQPQTQPQVQTQAPQQQGMHSSNLPQSQHVTQQGGQSLQQDMRHHSLQPIQDSVPKQEQSTAGLPRADIRASSIPGSNRQAAKQESVPEQSGSVRQLKVEDALAYLEQVKSQFSGNPGVYNHFLDIMKEFKANTIDTAEVITRVSSLFQGHRELILGFNTFLPPGYRIELRSDPTTGCVTGFSSPGGVFFPLNEAQPEPQPDGQQQPVAYNAQSDIRRQVSHVPPMPVDPSTHHFPAQGGHPVAPPVDSTHQGRNSAMETAFDRGGYQQPTSTNDKEKHLGIVSQSQQGVSMGQDSKGHLMQNATNDNAAAALADRFGSPNLGAAVPGKPIEFDQAVTYVNKIKSRFSEDQQVYRTFLGILQTYQKEQKSIKEVYKQVSLLFKDHDDLLGEFSKFLPEQPSQVPRQGGSTSQRISTESGPNRRKPGVSHTKQQPIIEGGAPENTSPTVLEAKGKENTTKPSGKGRAGKANANSLGATGGIAKPSASARHKASVQDKKQKRIAPNGKKPATDGKAGVMVGSGHRSHLIRSEGAAPELEFFDELRSLLGPEGQQNYSEFIKCLSLFSQEIICGDELMRLADGLLNHRKPLTDAFRAFLDQSDPRATQTAVDILRRAKTSSDEADGTGATARVSSGPPVINTSAVRERLRGLPPIADIGSSGGSGNTPGCRSPKLNPLYKGKPLSQIGRDFGTELAGTRSYVTLPANAVQIQCSGMTTNDRSVLNHMFVSKTDQVRTKLLDDDPSWNKLTGKRQERSTISSRGTQGNITAMPPIASNEDASPRSTWKKTAESLSIEDQRIELEVMIARAQSTVQKLEQLTKGEIRNASSFTAVDFKPIELIYKDAANDIIDVLRSNPSLTAPVVLQRVQQRLADWRTSQKKMEQLWKSSRFNDYNKLIGGPRTWRRSELKDELMRNDGSYGLINSGEKGVHYQSHVKKLDCELVCEDENLSVICDILWYAFEWEAENVETADKGLEFVERVYGVIQQVHRKGISMYVDEHLYVYLRLLTEASQRVRYILEHNYDGLTTESLVQKVKDVLGGTVSLPAYDDHCRKLYGDSGEWTAFLSDFPLVCKRLAEAALSVPQMKTANELLHLAEGSVQSEDSSEAHESDATMSDEKESKSLEKTLSHPSLSHPRQRLRAAMKVAAIPEVDIFEVEVVREEKDQRPSGNSAVNCRVILRMRHVPKATAAQFERFKQTKVPDEETVSSALTKYIRRALKRKRYNDALSGRKEQESAIHRKDGLDVRLLDGNGEIMYVMGTEDYLMKAAFVRRVSARLAKSHKHPRSLLPAKDDPKEISTA